MNKNMVYNIDSTKSILNIISFNKLYLLCLFLTPINISLPGLTLSLGDFIIVPLVICILFQLSKGVRIDKHKKEILLKVLAFFFILLVIIILSMTNYLFVDFPLNKPMIEVFKITIALLYGVVFAFYFAQIKTADGYIKFLKVSFYGTMIVSITCIIGVILYRLGIETTWVQNGFRGTGVMHDPNITSIYLTTQIALMAIYYAITKSKKVMVGIIIAIIAILSTASKAAILVLAINIIILFLLLFIIGRVKLGGKLLFILIISFIVLVVIANNTQLLEGILLRLNEFRSGDASQVTTGRTDLWRFALALSIQPNNFFTGIGYGAFRYYILGQSVPSYLSGITLVHNTFISFLTETGIFSVFILLSGMLTIIFNNLFCILKKKSIFGIFLFWGVITVFIGLNEVNLQNNRLMYIFLVFSYFTLKEIKAAKKELSLEILIGGNSKY